MEPEPRRGCACLYRVENRRYLSIARATLGRTQSCQEKVTD